MKFIANTLTIKVAAVAAIAVLGFLSVVATVSELRSYTSEATIETESEAAISGEFVDSQSHEGTSESDTLSDLACKRCTRSSDGATLVWSHSWQQYP